MFAGPHTNVYQIVLKFNYPIENIKKKRVGFLPSKIFSNYCNKFSKKISHSFLFSLSLIAAHHHHLEVEIS